MIVLLRQLSLVFVLAVVVQWPAHSKEFTFFHEDVLGTSLELRLHANDEAAAMAAESRGLAEIDRLSSIYSHYDPQSEFSRLIQTPIGQSVVASRELCDLLERCDYWRSTSGGAFEPATERLASVWSHAAQSGIAPPAKQIAAAVRELRQAHWRVERASQRVVRTSSVPLSLNAIAKGDILDRVAHVLVTSAGVQGVMLNIGGDIRVMGTMSTTMNIARPDADTIGGQTLATLVVNDAAVATSGNSERYFEVAGTRHSHLIDPRTGMPVTQTTNATVIAMDASTADALATICSVLEIQESVSLVDSIPGAECLLVSRTGTVATSANWPSDSARQAQTTMLVAAHETSAAHEMVVEFELAKADDARRYRRPYVAVWVEDKDAFPVKTLSLFLMQKDPGPRWYRDLRRWYTDDQMRKLVDETDLIATVSKPTRNPGRYKVSWDGRDDSGKTLPPGKYTLLVESAREHGGYQLMKHEFELGTSFDKTLVPNKEISSVKIHYVAK